MAIDEVIERATIEFPRQLNENQVKDFLKYVWQKSGYAVTLDETRKSSLGSIFTEPREGDEFEEMQTDLDGCFTKSRGRSAGFSCEHKLDEYTSFSGIRFDIAGYDHGIPEDLGLIFDTIRTHARHYFRENF